MNRPLVLSLIVTASLLVLTPAAIASPRPDHSHRHHDSSDWAGSGDGRGDLHRRDAVWSFYDNRDDDDSDSSDDSSDDSDSDSGDDATTGTGGAVVAPETGTQAAAGGSVVSGTPRTITADLTAYDFSDNQGGSNSTICCAKLHQQAGGTGTYADPITTAVPGSGGSGMQTPAGARIYVPSLAAYFIVEDSGATPSSRTRFDLWLDGRGLSSASACMDRVTRTTQVIINPPAGKPVGHVGPLADASGCHVAATGSN